ncbi:acyl-CoA transferase [Bosea sp. Root483D1]|uniref:CaiB/BaiF CoA transferase family protein n=1 Tax=Bosea sp. Root483D1 TaxID=1736544 RepID=UPI00070C3DB8|nr:CoA transferase [Bosea sp. Root483D1]KRE17383.1 acyl-CoA transferase [Bosea sp. Root483D1]
MTQHPNAPTGRIVSYAPDAAGPLTGLKVLDLSRLVAGNVLSVQLADFGADVVKIEPPEGDALRFWKEAGKELYWASYCRNKRSIGLNLRDPKAREILLDMVRTADVLVENYRPGTLEKMGLAPAVLHEANDRLVLVRISGFGQTGPYSPLPGFGTLVEAMSGFAARTGFPDREPVLPQNPLADMMAGLQGAFAVVTAVLARNEKGVRNQIVDVALLEPLFSTMGTDLAVYRQNGQVAPRQGSGSNGSAPRNVYCCRDDKFVALSASTQSTAVRVFDVIGRPELKDDPRFATNTTRVEHREDLDDALAAWFATKTRPQALAAMQAGEVPVAAIYDVADISADPHFIEREVFVEAEDEDGSYVPMHNISPRLSASPGAFRCPAPRLGEHSDDLLGALGYGLDDIRALRSAGVVI